MRGCGPSAQRFPVVAFGVNAFRSKALPIVVSVQPESEAAAHGVEPDCVTMGFTASLSAASSDRAGQTAPRPTPQLAANAI
jgi:hypothetical protein